MNQIETYEKLRIGILGFGTVGQATYRLIEEHKWRLSRIIRKLPIVVGASVRDIQKVRYQSKLKLCSNPWELVNCPDVDLIIESMGGIDPAFLLIKKAIESGKGVVTANKELIAKHGEELMQLASACEVPFLFEAAVGGGIPIVKALHLQLQGSQIARIDGIFNGTTNYILTKMKKSGLNYSDALHQAQVAGFAESDPKNDVEGFDTAYKIAILGWLSQRKPIDFRGIEREGITQITPLDHRLAEELQSIIKLIGVFEIRPAGYGCRVRPMLVPLHHQYASVDDEFNAVTVYGDFVGSITMVGKGAGGDPTASSIVGDVIASQLIISKMNWTFHDQQLSSDDWSLDHEWVGNYYIRFPETMRSIVRRQMSREGIEITRTTKTIDENSAFVSSPVSEEKIHFALDRMPHPYSSELIKWIPLL